MNLSKKKLIFLIVLSSFLLNLIFTGIVVYLQKREFSGDALFSSAKTSLGLLSRDIAEGNYRRAMEQVSSKGLPQSKSIIFYDLASDRTITSNIASSRFLCRGQEKESYFEFVEQGHLSCVLINAALMAQIISEVRPFDFLKTPIFLTLMGMNTLFALVLTLLVFWGMNFYLDRFLFLLDGILKKGPIQKNIPVEFKSSFEAIEKLSKSLERLKKEVSRSGEELAFNEISKKVIHNIKNPLNIINLNLPLIKTGMSDRVENNLRDAIENIESGITRALKSYRHETSPISVCLYEVLNKAIEEVASQNLKNKKISISPLKACPKSQDHIAEANPEDFKAAVINILNNAVQAMPDGGSIQVEMSVKEGGPALITLSDEGTGIDEAVLHKIGTQGFSYNKEGGHGLGLYTAKRDIESWGGRLTIENRRDRKGVVVTITL
ncbi:MAG: HAMP domain-containing sensor histidine kinase [Bacteriovoracales bacterium]|nr:HAMP domain-containing sensor histidine kinase [Bacteriovoracales bacterium]